MARLEVWEAAEVGAFVGILAHQGGWDELLMVAVPIGLFVALLRIANVRAARQAGADASERPRRPSTGSDIDRNP